MNDDRNPPQGTDRIDLARVRARLAETRGPEYWRSLDELAGTEEFQDWLHREFPRQASEWVEAPEDGVSRRRFLQLAGGSLALAGLAACTKQPPERIVPYVRQPEEVVPGRPLFFATTLTHRGYGLGVLAESHEGRPTKIEGNPDHPASLGASDAWAQAAVLTLYDPQRSQSLTELGRIRTWGGFVNAVAGPIRALRGLGGEGLRILTGTVTSPTMADQMRALAGQYPRARWHRWEADGGHAAYQAAVAAFGRPLDAVYDFTRARVILTIDSDVLCHGPGNVRYSRDFARNRRVRAASPAMNRLYSVESSPTTTSTLADHRLPLSPGEVEAFTLALAAALGAAPGAPAGLADALPEKARPWVPALARDLRANAGASLVVAGPHASPAVQVLAHAINGALGNAGATVSYIPPVEADPVDHVASLAELVRDLNAGRVEMLLIAGTNPVYSAPADFNFAGALVKARVRIHHGLYHDETAELCQWHVPATHELESWSDARAFDGTASIAQPLIEPLYGGKSIHEVLAVFFDRIDATAYDVVHERWSRQLPGGAGSGQLPGGAGSDGAERAWRRVLHDGVIPGTAATPAPAAVAGGAVAGAVAAIAAAARAAAGGGAAADGGPGGGELTLLFRPDPTIDDGRYAENAWLQELPKPINKLTWDNALMLSPATAERLQLATQDVVEIEAAGRRLRAAVWVQPGHGDGCATLTLGYGRSRAGHVGSGRGFNAYRLRTSRTLGSVPGVRLAKTGETYPLACTQNHHLLENGMDEIPVATEQAAQRRPVRTGLLEQFRGNPSFIKEVEPGGHERKLDTEGLTTISLYPEYKYEGYKWGMGIDLTVCTGCSACVVACQAENNIPTVGKEQVLKGREMHWLRIDRYFEGDLDDPVMHNQPVPCMHCEKAPCEVVCPVAATVHSAEGLNDMVYNRCVGTRYCSNNCPYKVRRFNFLRYSNHDVPVLKLLQNPDVTVRMRGVMEKCTYCVQRINGARIGAEIEGRRVRPGEVQTACQQACPTEAIVFGDLNNPDWEVTRRRAEPHKYDLLEELATQPRTTYLAKLRNVNPELHAAERT